MSQTFTCPNCGAPQDYKGGSAATIQCPYCDTTLIVPEALRTPAPDAGSFNAADWAGQAGALVQVKQLVDSGKTLDAIKLYRQTFSATLAEGKAAVEAIRGGRNMQVAKITLERPGDVEGALPGRNIQIDLTGSGGARPTARATGCVTLAIIGFVLVIVASIVLPLIFGGIGLMQGFQAAEQAVRVPTEILIAQEVIAELTATARPNATRAPSVTPTPGFARVMRQIGTAGTGPGQFKDARYITLDQQGNLFVGESTGSRIQRLDPQGVFQDQWLMNPKVPLRGLAADFRGNVYAVQDGVITKFNAATGDKVGELEFGGGPGFDDVAVLPDGGLVATWYENRTGIITSIEGNRDDLVRFDRNGKVTQVVKGIVSGQTGDPELDNKLAVDGQANIYILSGTFDDAVFKYSYEGKFITRFGSRGEAAGQFSSPNDIATDGQGRVYVADSNRVLVFAGDGRYLDSTGPIQGPAFGLAVDSGDHLWVVTGTQVNEFELKK